MLKITKEGESGPSLEPLGYAEGRGLAARAILGITRWLRAVNALKYITSGRRHLDIGCGDGYFLRRCKCQERFGLDKLLGDEVKGQLDFPDSYFDSVTMLAVIEHFSDPGAIIKEVGRVLIPGGRLVITTPKESAKWMIKLYAKISTNHTSHTWT